MTTTARKLTLKLPPINKEILAKKIKARIQPVLARDKNLRPAEPKKERLSLNQYKKMLVFFQKEYPKCFVTPVQPLKIRIRQEIHKNHRDKFSIRILKMFFRKYCWQKEYLKVHTEGANRIDLNGDIVDMIKPEQVEKVGDAYIKKNSRSKSYRS
jgi:sRNA-binding protein